MNVAANVNNGAPNKIANTYLVNTILRARTSPTPFTSTTTASSHSARRSAMHSSP